MAHSPLYSLTQKTVNMKVEGYVSEIAAINSARPDLLLQYLIDIQNFHHCIPDTLIKSLAHELNRSEADIKGVIGFYSFLHLQSRGSYEVLISDNITDQLLGSRHLKDKLCERLELVQGVPRKDGRVTVDSTSCTGMCDQGPAMLVNGRAIPRLDTGRITRICDLIESATPIERWPQFLFQIDDNIQRRDLLLSDESESGQALASLVARGRTSLLKQIQSSGLRGRGGAGFKTGLKWQFCQQTQAEQRYVVCNADEGEPGTFKDRVLLNTEAEKIFEGMTLCAGIVGASKGLVYLRWEYQYLREHLERVLEARRKAGLLGDAILNKLGFNFDIEIQMGAGAYICGEESALIESLEGKRGIPRNRPPFPVTLGYKNQPTVVNNVETFLAATLIAVHGANWFRSVGTTQSSGTKLLSISGDCDHPGVYEYPFGVSIQQILEDCGARTPQAVQVSGAAGRTLTAREFDRCIAFEDVQTGGSFMVFNQQRDLLDVMKNFVHFFAHESCGFCTPCRVGGVLMKDLVDKLHSGHASHYDVQEMRNIATLMQSSSHCGLGSSAPNPVLDILNKFPATYEPRLAQSDYEPAFDLDAALQEARDISGRDDAGAHIRLKA